MSSSCFYCGSPASTPKSRLDFSQVSLKTQSRTLDLHEVDEILTLCNKTLDDYEDEITRLETQIVSIKVQQEQLRTYKKNLLALTSPIQKVPNELLGIIFDYSCEWNVLDQSWNGPESQTFFGLKAPAITYLPTLALGSVCTRWRKIVGGYPALWSRLELKVISHGPAAPAVPDAFINTIKLFLSRSCSAPLMIDLSIFGDPHDRCLFPLSLLTEHSQRWIAFKLGSYHFLSSYLKDNFNASFPLLETLDLECYGGGQVEEHLHFFRNAPKLKNLRLPGSVLKSQMSWNQLNSIFVDLSDADGPVSTVLDVPAGITSLDVEWRGTVDGVLSCTPPITFKTITALNLNLSDELNWSCHEIDDVNLLGAMLASSTFPALTQLHIQQKACGEVEDGKWPGQGFSTFLGRSRCSITTLDLNVLYLTATDLINTLQLLPSLVTLDISDYNARQANSKASPITTNVIHALHSSGTKESLTASGGPLVPHLRHLGLDFGGQIFDDGAFIEMVSSRWVPDARDSVDVASQRVGVDCIREVVMRFRRREVREEIYKPLRKLDKMGLMVVVRGMNETMI